MSASLSNARISTFADHLLARAVEMGATDVHLQAQQFPRARLQGTMVTFGERIIENADLSQIALQVLTNDQRQSFQQGLNVDVAYEIHGLGRFRFNFSRSRGLIVVAIRIVPLRVPSFEDLNLPPILQNISNYRRGLVLVVGTTGSGKSTTLASMIHHISSTQKCHIVSIEDPIEYVFHQGKGLITQKEVGRDVADYPSAMRAVLRQDPDVIMIGEMRDRETIDTALLAAETGHFVVSTLHTLDAPETIHRILSAYPAGQQLQVRHQLASILKAVVALRLVPRIDGSGVLPAVEVLVNNDRIKDMIAKPDRIHEIPTAIEESFESFGMRTFDQSLMDLLSRGLISYDTAIANASRPGLFDLRASGISSMGGEKKWGQFEKAGEVALKEEAARREKSLRTEKTKTTTRTRGTGSWFSSAKSAADDATTASSATGGSLRLPPPSRSSSARIVEREYRPGSPAGSAREETVAFDIETASGLRPTRSGRRRSSSSRSRAYVPDDNRDLNVWLLSSLFGIFTGFFIWWATNRPPQTEPALRGEPARTYSSSRAKSAFNSKSKLKSRKPASLKRAKPARDE